MPMKIVRVTICSLGFLLLGGCGNEPPPVSVTEFMENPRLLEATMVRCGQNRAEMKYESECVNAREAVNRLERAEERARREELEAQSERKREALRRTQEAAAAARQRALEAQRRREEAEYLGVFEAAPEPGIAAGDPDTNAPMATIGPEPESVEQATPEDTAAPGEPADLGAVREELRRRQQPPEQGQ